MTPQEIPANVEVKHCRVCSYPHMRPLFSFGNLYVNNFVTEEVVKSGYKDCPKCPIDVEQCPRCTLVQLRHSAPQELLYSRKYWYRSGVTQTMKDGLKNVADTARKIVRLQPGDTILDIGSNDGTLLRSYDTRTFLEHEKMSDPGEAIIDCDYMGHDRYQPVTVGIEPASNLAEVGAEGVDIFINDFWSADTYLKIRQDHHYQWGSKADGYKAKIITALGMFYDLEQPITFIQDIAKVLHPEGVFIAQLMCLQQTVDKLDVGNFCHEHLEYYTLQSLKFMFDTCGLEIFDIEENNINGGSYRLYIKHKACTSGLTIKEGAAERVQQAFAAEASLSEPRVLIEAYHTMLSQAQALQWLIREKVKRRNAVYVYGASTKGNTILQFAGIDHTLIKAAGDKDPNKTGLRTIGTGIPIITIEALRQLGPDYALILPYAFENEILQQEQDTKWRKQGGKFIIPIPSVRIV